GYCSKGRRAAGRFRPVSSAAWKCDMTDHVQIWVTDLAEKENPRFLRQIVYLSHRAMTVTKSWQLQAYVEGCQREGRKPDSGTEGAEVKLPDSYLQLKPYHVRTERVLDEALTLKRQDVKEGDVFVLSPLENEIVAAIARNIGVPPSISPKKYPYKPLVRLRDL